MLGIGERNGITPLGGFVARMLVADRDYVKGKYDLTKLKAVEDLVAAAVEINVPFNNYITGFCAFTHSETSLAIVSVLPCFPRKDNADLEKYNRGWYPCQSDTSQPHHVRSVFPQPFAQVNWEPRNIISGLPCSPESTVLTWRNTTEIINPADFGMTRYGE